MPGDPIDADRNRAPSVEVVVPTYREAESIPHLVERLRVLREKTGLDLELLLMDDNSGDGSQELVRSMNLPWVRIVVRSADRGLSQAVLDGLRRSERDVFVVMDADLSHPPEKIPEMLEALGRGADFALGSRFAEGGSIAEDWSLFRWLNSRVATLLALPLTRLKDPMSGFFALRRSTFVGGRDLNPIGYKIGLELVIKCGCTRVVEIPIHFSDRRFGQSKLSLKEQLKYLQHIRRLYIYKYGTWSHLAQFLVVGFSGLLVNLLVLTLARAERSLQAGDCAGHRALDGLELCPQPQVHVLVRTTSIGRSTVHWFRRDLLPRCARELPGHGSYLAVVPLQAGRRRPRCPRRDCVQLHRQPLHGIPQSARRGWTSSRRAAALRRGRAHPAAPFALCVSEPARSRITRAK